MFPSPSPCMRPGSFFDSHRPKYRSEALLSNLLKGVTTFFSMVGTKGRRPFETFSQLVFVSIPLFFTFADWKQSCMTWREHEEVNKVQALSGQPVSDHIFYMQPAEFAEVFCVDDNPAACARFHFSGFEPAAGDPVPDLLRTNMEG